MAYYSCHINRYKYEWYYKGDDKTVWRDMCHDSYFLYFFLSYCVLYQVEV